MLQVQYFTYNPFQENTYVIYNDRNECWIIDPGMMAEEETAHFCSFLEEKHLQPQAIVNTHAHIDHILGVDAIAQRFSIPFLLHEQERPVLENAANTALRFGFKYAGVQTAPTYITEQASPFGTEIIDIRFVPGHSPGSIAFYHPAGNWVIGGDALFQESIGRTDLPGGDHDTLINSIRQQLFTLPDQTTVYAGHGAPTTIGHEKQHNPFLR